VAISSLVMGSILSTALLIGPANIALRLASSVKNAAFLALIVGCLATTGGVVLAYDSFYWSSSGRGLPVSFFIVVLLMVFYTLAKLLDIFRLANSKKEAA
jgi:zinc/manganese transport system permease protein